MPSLKINIGITFLSTVIYSFCQWSAVAIIAKISGPFEVGVYALAISITGPVFALSNMNLRSIQSTDSASKFNYSTYKKFRKITSVLGFIAVLCLALWFGDEQSVIVFIIIYGVAKFFESISELKYGQFQKQERMDLIAYSVMMRSIAIIVSFGIVYGVTKNMLSGAFSLVIFLALICYLFDDYFLKKVFVDDGKHEKQSIKELFYLALPLGFTVFGNAVNVNIPRYFVVEQMGQYELGIYAAVSYFIVAGSTIVNAIGQSVTPRLARMALADKNDFIALLSKMLGAVIVIGFLGVTIAYFVGDLILKFVYTDEFSDNRVLFVWVMISGAAMYCSTVLGCGLTALRKFKIQAVLSVMVTLILVVLCYPLIWQYGVVGCAIAITCSYVVKFLVSSVMLFRYVNVD
jgi:O-antigen/teichoic acid export membrane protein